MITTGVAELSAVRVEGGILSPSLVQRISSRDPALPGMDAADYHLDPGISFGEAITRSWNRLRTAWERFSRERSGLPKGDSQAAFTRERLLLVLFDELGYGRLPYHGGIDLNEERFAISHEWEHVPIHLVGADVDLEARAAGVAGAARRSPHALVQELLNRSDRHLWGVVSNGRLLRIMRDNRSITRLPYIEFDLEAIFDGELYSDFGLLWLLAHQSRLEGEPPESCWLERWRDLGAQEGERALDDLRRGVEEALTALGSGFLSTPGNGTLLESLASGALPTQQYYRYLLRLVYRLIFLFVGEDRGLLFAPYAPPEARVIYRRFYSTARLRELASRFRGSHHLDLYEGLRTVMSALDTAGAPELGLPALGSFLWAPEAIGDLDKAALTNADLLAAIRSLTFTVHAGALWPTNFRDLGSEELGSVYESLLELHPLINRQSGSFELQTAAGHERKTSGSYYTPDSLVQQLLNTTLDPVIDRAMKESDPEVALLSLKVCDPAAGSGHFLVAAAQRIAKRIAQVRTGDPEPAPEPVRHAKREVIGHCLYGVDVNPMAVELCKVSLWMEALEPGKPLSFLDHHIKAGNSLLGATREVMERGIPDEAFVVLSLDSSEIVREMKRVNKKEREEEGDAQILFDYWKDLCEGHAKVARNARELSDLSDSTLEGVRLLADRYQSLLHDSGYLTELAVANAWSAAFVWRKDRNTPTNHPITQRWLRLYLTNPESVPNWMVEESSRLAAEYHFFHWHLAFPEVFERTNGREPGFDAVIGNPPWDQLQFSESEWFAERDPAIAKAANADARKRMIALLSSDKPILFHSYLEAKREVESQSALCSNTGRFPLCGHGKLNLYALFVELARSLIARDGRTGMIVPSGIATDDTTKEFFSDLVAKRRLASLYDFENHGIFASVHDSYKFCLLTVAGSDLRNDFATEFVFFAHSVRDLGDPERVVYLTADDFARINPNTRTAPIFRTRRDAEITRTVYRKVPVFIREDDPDGNPWKVAFAQGLFNMASDSGLFQTREQMETQRYRLERNSFVHEKGENEGISDKNQERRAEVWLPLYEAKMIHHYDHRWATYAGLDIRDVPESEKRDPKYMGLPRYWVPLTVVEEQLRDRWDRPWLLGWRDIYRSTDERTVIATVVPRVAVGDTFLLVIPGAPIGRLIWPLISNLDSLVLDFVARQKVGGTHLKYHVFRQLPILPPSAYTALCAWADPVDSEGPTLADWIKPRVLELVYTAVDMEPFARDLGYEGPPFVWNEERRFQLRCELDAAYFHLYGISRDDAAYIMETFFIVRKRDYDRFGSYRTKDTILEIYDEMAKKIGK